MLAVLAVCLAQLVNLQGPWGIGQFLVVAIMVAAGVGIAIIAFRYFQVWPPQWLINIVMICVVAFVAILAIKFVFGL
jgi:hypothetical protein